MTTRRWIHKNQNKINLDLWNLQKTFPSVNIFTPRVPKPPPLHLEIRWSVYICFPDTWIYVRIHNHNLHQHCLSVFNNISLSLIFIYNTEHLLLYCFYSPGILFHCPTFCIARYYYFIILSASFTKESILHSLFIIPFQCRTFWISFKYSLSSWTSCFWCK